MNMPPPLTQYQHALIAQARGWHIFPCEPRDKRGALLQPGRPYRIRWYEMASNNLDVIKGWWQQRPDYNIGISAKKSNLLVVDCDTPKEPGALEDGYDQFRLLAKKHGADWGSVISTYQVETPSLGVHLYYQWPEGVKASQRSLDSLLDVRTNGGEKGGYVVGAGSVTDGWYRVIREEPVQPVPPWLLNLVKFKEGETRLDAPLGGKRGNRLDSFFDEYHGLRRAVAEAVEGNRNETLNWAAHQMAGDGCTKEQIIKELADPARDAGLAELEIMRTIQSAARSRGATP